MSDFNEEIIESIYKCFFDEVEKRLRRIRPMKGGVTVTRKPTNFVMDGEHFTVGSDDPDFSEMAITFWLGLNEHRMIFITYLNREKVECEQVFQYCFSGATKAGWGINYEALDHHMVGGVLSGCSVWGSCSASQPMVDWARSDGLLTPGGHFWATDVAMMVQSILRTAERNDVASLEKLPEPL